MSDGSFTFRVTPDMLDNFDVAAVPLVDIHPCRCWCDDCLSAWLSGDWGAS